jgi:hypothetical protein
MAVKQQSGGEGRENSLQQLRRVVSEALVAPERRQKSVFVDGVKALGFDAQLASLFGIRQIDRTGWLEQYEDAASTWWDRNFDRLHKVTQEMPPLELECKKLPETPEEAATRLQMVSKSLAPIVGGMQVMKVKSTSGKRDATLILPEGANLPPEDLENMKKALDFWEPIPGVSMKSPHGTRHMHSWQRIMPDRTLIILPAGVTEVDENSLNYPGKGLRINPDSTEQFDLLEAQRYINGGEPTEGVYRVDETIDEDGITHRHRRPLEPVGGMDYVKAETEFGMRLLAVRQRGLADLIDEPVAYGFFDSIKSAEGRQQGFVFVRALDASQRGDHEVNSTNYAYAAKILADDPVKRGKIIDETSQGIGQIIKAVHDGIFKKAFGSRYDKHDEEQFLSILGAFRDQAEGYRDVDDEEGLKMLPFLSGFLSSFWVPVPDYGILLDGINPGMRYRWIHDVSQPYIGSAIAARLLIDRGIAHEQPYTGNIRFRRPEPRVRSLIVCDMHDCHDLVDCTYPQAVGQIARSARTLVNTVLAGRNHYLVGQIQEQLLEESLRHFTQPYSGEKAGLIEAVVTEALNRDEKEIHDRMVEIDLDYDSRMVRPQARTLFETAYYACEFHPVTEVDSPLFKLVKIIYPPEKHQQLKARFGQG